MVVILMSIVCDSVRSLSYLRLADHTGAITIYSQNLRLVGAPLIHTTGPVQRGQRAVLLCPSASALETRRTYLMRALVTAFLLAFVVTGAQTQQFTTGAA